MDKVKDAQDQNGLYFPSNDAHWIKCCNCSTWLLMPLPLQKDYLIYRLKKSSSSFDHWILESSDYFLQWCCWSKIKVVTTFLQTFIAKGFI